MQAAMLHYAAMRTSGKSGKWNSAALNILNSRKNGSKNYQNYTTQSKETKPSLSYVWTILCELHLAFGKVAFNNRPIAPSKDPDAGSPSTPWCLPCTRTSQTPGANAAHMLHKFVHFRATPLGMSPRAPLPRSDHTKTSLQLRFELSAGDRGSFMHIRDRVWNPYHTNEHTEHIWKRNRFHFPSVKLLKKTPEIDGGAIHRLLPKSGRPRTKITWSNMPRSSQENRRNVWQICLHWGSNWACSDPSCKLGQQPPARLLARSAALIECISSYYKLIQIN